ncbi:MAG: hypothetical protein AB7H77_09270 [Bdellovibrionales bacterium]
MKQNSKNTARKHGDFKKVGYISCSQIISIGDNEFEVRSEITRKGEARTYAWTRAKGGWGWSCANHNNLPAKVQKVFDKYQAEALHYLEFNREEIAAELAFNGEPHIHVSIKTTPMGVEKCDGFDQQAAAMLAMYRAAPEGHAFAVRMMEYFSHNPNGYQDLREQCAAYLEKAGV